MKIVYTINSIKNNNLHYILTLFNDTFSILLTDKLTDKNIHNANKNECYGEIFMKKISDTNVLMTEFIIHSYKFNQPIDGRSWLKGMGKELLFIAVTEIMKQFPTLTHLEGRVTAIEKIRNENVSRNALIKMYENMGAYIIKDTKLYTDMETRLSDVLVYCQS
jgi:hypothetical protein